MPISIVTGAMAPERLTAPIPVIENVRARLLTVRESMATEAAWAGGNGTNRLSAATTYLIQEEVTNKKERTDITSSPT